MWPEDARIGRSASATTDRGQDHEGDHAGTVAGQRPQFVQHDVGARDRPAAEAPAGAGVVLQVAGQHGEPPVRPRRDAGQGRRQKRAEQVVADLLDGVQRRAGQLVRVADVCAGRVALFVDDGGEGEPPRGGQPGGERAVRVPADAVQHRTPPAGIGAAGSDEVARLRPGHREDLDPGGVLEPAVLGGQRPVVAAAAGHDQRRLVPEPLVVVEHPQRVRRPRGVARRPGGVQLVEAVDHRQDQARIDQGLRRPRREPVHPGQVRHQPRLHGGVDAEVRSRQAHRHRIAGRPVLQQHHHQLDGQDGLARSRRAGEHHASRPQPAVVAGHAAQPALRVGVLGVVRRRRPELEPYVDRALRNAQQLPPGPLFRGEHRGGQLPGQHRGVGQLPPPVPNREHDRGQQAGGPEEHARRVDIADLPRMQRPRQQPEPGQPRRRVSRHPQPTSTHE